jgi:hypothetical protein
LLVRSKSGDSLLDRLETLTDSIVCDIFEYILRMDDLIWLAQGEVIHLLHVVHACLLVPPMDSYFAIVDIAGKGEMAGADGRRVSIGVSSAVEAV